jgi:hypothetical protein
MREEASYRRLALVALFLGGAVSAQAQGYTASGGDNRSQPVKTLEDCFARMYADGAYLSSDGGRSAKRLLAKCPDEWASAAQECEKVSGDPTQTCKTKTGGLAQEFLKAQERDLH